MAGLFIYDGRTFPDPDPKVPVEDIRKQLAEFFPELANAETQEERRGEDTVYTFSRRIGTKGRRLHPDVVTILRRVPEKRLRLFELATELLDRTGSASGLAVAEVEAYARATRQVARSRRAPETHASRRSAPHARSADTSPRTESGWQDSPGLVVCRKAMPPAGAGPPPGTGPVVTVPPARGTAPQLATRGYAHEWQDGQRPQSIC